MSVQSRKCVTSAVKGWEQDTWGWKWLNAPLKTLLNVTGRDDEAVSSWRARFGYSSVINTKKTLSHPPSGLWAFLMWIISVTNTTTTTATSLFSAAVSSAASVRAWALPAEPRGGDAVARRPEEAKVGHTTSCSDDWSRHKRAKLTGWRLREKKNSHKWFGGGGH